VWAVDVNQRAIDLCNGNAAAAGLVNVRCVAAAGAAQEGACDNKADLPGSYQLIWSNPPIRIGKQALHELLRIWLGQLAPGAAAYLVVQRNLGSDSLQRWLSEAGWQANRFAARAGYRVLEVRR
jgi:16S rRNA (guanine1207-N2)-methyltransferase